MSGQADATRGRPSAAVPLEVARIVGSTGVAKRGHLQRGRPCQ